jgi:prepilin-type N-terminal cleavage/methylation domain-containing protein
MNRSWKQCHRDQEGFTLFEVLISMVILALAMTVVLMGFQTVTSSWRRGEERIEAQQENRLIMEKLSTLIRSTYPSHPIIEGRRITQFIGGSDSLRIVTTGAMNILGEKNPGIYEALIYVDDDPATEVEGLMMRQDYVEGLKIEDYDTSQLIEICPDIDTIEFEYYYETFNETGEREGNWIEEWNQEEDELEFLEFIPEHPRAIKFRLGRWDDDRREVRLLPDQLVPVYIGMDYYLRPYYTFSLFDR